MAFYLEELVLSFCSFRQLESDLIKIYKVGSVFEARDWDCPVV